MIRGKVWKFPNDVNTDYIIPGKYKFKTLDMKELAQHAMEGIDPEFAKKVENGDIIVAGKNFGMGSSRSRRPSFEICRSFNCYSRRLRSNILQKRVQRRVSSTNMQRNKRKG